MCNNGPKMYMYTMLVINAIKLYCVCVVLGDDHDAGHVLVNHG